VASRHLHRSIRSRAAVAAGAGVAMFVLGAGAAFAYFSSTGSGHGSARTGTLQTVTVSALVGGDTPSSTLLPGGPAADVVLRVNNPNAFAVTLVSVTGGPGAITGAGGTGTCTTTGVTFTNQNNLSVAIGASGTTLVHLAGAASMSASSDAGCQGATFSIPVTITVHQG